MSYRLNESGVTLIELMTVMVITTIMIGTISIFMYNYWRLGTTLQTDQETLVSRMDAGDYLRDAIDSASGLINQNDIPDPHTGVADPAQPSGTYWEVIHAIPSSVSITPGVITPLMYFNRPSMDKFKNIILNGTTPYQDDVVVYLDGSSNDLLARTIANPYAPSNAAKTTCPPAIATTSCPSDKIISEHITQVDTKYFSRSGNTIDYTSIIDPNTGEYAGPDFPAVEVVELNLHLFQKSKVSQGVSTSNQAIIRVALRN